MSIERFAKAAEARYNKLLERHLPEVVFYGKLKRYFRDDVWSPLSTLYKNGKITLPLDDKVPKLVIEQRQRDKLEEEDEEEKPQEKEQLLLQAMEETIKSKE